MEHLWDLLRQDPFWPIWVEQDEKSPADWKKTNEALGTRATSEDGLLKRLERKLNDLHGNKNALLIVTDLEALHPFLRIGSIESKLQGSFYVPTIFLYPGMRTGKSGLKFLGFYPEDGNYRSVHVGG